LRGLEPDVLAVLVAADELRLAGSQSRVHGLSDGEVALVELTLLLLSAGALLLALFVRAARDLVFHFAAEGFLLRGFVAVREVLRDVLVF